MREWKCKGKKKYGFTFLVGYLPYGSEQVYAHTLTVYSYAGIRQAEFMFKSISQIWVFRRVAFFAMKTMVKRNNKTVRKELRKLYENLGFGF